MRKLTPHVSREISDRGSLENSRCHFAYAGTMPESGFGEFKERRGECLLRRIDSGTLGSTSSEVGALQLSRDNQNQKIRLFAALRIQVNSCQLHTRLELVMSGKSATLDHFVSMVDFCQRSLTLLENLEK